MWEYETCVNNIDIYIVSTEALGVFKKSAVKGDIQSTDLIQRKLTALIMSSNNKKHVVGDKFAVMFGNFKMIINEATKHVEVLFWDEDFRGRVAKEELVKLRNMYRLLGLNCKGDNIKEDM